MMHGTLLAVIAVVVGASNEVGKKFLEAKYTHLPIMHAHARQCTHILVARW